MLFQMNVVPNQLTIGFDIRITPTTNIVEFENKIRNWTEEVIFRLMLTFMVLLMFKCKVISSNSKALRVSLVWRRSRR